MFSHCDPSVLVQYQVLLHIILKDLDPLTLNRYILVKVILALFSNLQLMASNPQLLPGMRPGVSPNFMMHTHSRRQVQPKNSSRRAGNPQHQLLLPTLEVLLIAVDAAQCQ